VINWIRRKLGLAIGLIRLFGHITFFQFLQQRRKSAGVTPSNCTSRHGSNDGTVLMPGALFGVRRGLWPNWSWGYFGKSF
jgi:hypothetical protein